MGIYKQPAGTQPYPKPASYGPHPGNFYSQGENLHGKSNPFQGGYKTEPSMYQPNQYQTNPSNMYQPGPYQPNQQNMYQPNQPGPYLPNQPDMYQPNQPNMYQPDMHQPNMYPPGLYQPNQPNVYHSDMNQPNQPNVYQTNQPNIYQSNQPDMYQPNQPNMYQPNQAHMYQPNQPSFNQNPGNLRLDQGMQQQLQGNLGMNFGPPFQTDMMQGSQAQFGQNGQVGQQQQQRQSSKPNPGTVSNVVQTRKKRSAEKRSNNRNARKEKHPVKKTDSATNSSKLTSPQRRIRQRKTGYRAPWFIYNFIYVINLFILSVGFQIGGFEKRI